LLGPGDLRVTILGPLPPGLDDEPEARTAIAVRRIGVGNACHSAAEMRNLDVRPGRREPFDVPRQAVSCLGVEVIERVAAPVIEDAGAAASVECALPLTVLHLADRAGYWRVQTRKSLRRSAALFSRAAVAQC